MKVTVYRETEEVVIPRQEVPVEFNLGGLVSKHAWLRQGEQSAMDEFAQARRALPFENEAPEVKALIEAAERIAFERGRMCGISEAVEYMLGGQNGLAFESASYQEHQRRTKEGAPLYEHDVFGVFGYYKRRQAPEGPRFEHSCEHCTFLGRYDARKPCDLYHCAHWGIHVRFADTAGGCDFPDEWAEAKRRAQERGLVPRFEHDCAECEFLGGYVSSANGPCDLYFCTKSDLGYTLLARYSDKPSDYQTGWGIDEATAEAKRRAVERGLIPKEG